LKRVWTAATTNFTIAKFEFADDMKIWVSGTEGVQVGSWVQVQDKKTGQSREIKGRATVLWRKRDGAWKVWHYHASITPPELNARRSRGGLVRRRAECLGGHFVASLPIT
jgi:ketosteroid isomerase-like protein